MYSASGDPALHNVVFNDNTVTSGSGGGMFILGGDPAMEAVSFISNTAASGGGMFVVDSRATMTEVVFAGNTANGTGGAMLNTSNSDITIANAVFSNNIALSDGGAIANTSSDPVITNASFSGNSTVLGSGEVLYNNSSDPVLTNVIMWDNSPGAQIANTLGAPVISYSLVEGSGGSGAGWDVTLGTDGGNNLDADPLFVDALGGNLRLQSGSPAIDAGDNSAPNLPATDLDGNPRVVGAAVDMGAYEFDPATGIDDAVVPGAAVYLSVYPNPFNPTVTVSFEVGKASDARVAIYDLRGSLVRELSRGMRPPGRHEVVWDAKDDGGRTVASGVYFIRVQSRDGSAHRKVLLLK
jgi:predicted outer membrane repeat protein